MSTKISDLAEQVKLSPKELKEKIKTLGFEISPRAKVVDDQLAELLLSELIEKAPAEAVTTEYAPGEEFAGDDREKSKIEQIEDFYDQQLEKEIVRKQRKQMAGKDKPADKSEVKAEIKPENLSGVVEIPEVISVKEFSEKCGLSPAKVIGELMKNGILANINQQIDYDTAAIIAGDMGIILKKAHTEASIEDLLERNLENLLKQDDPSVLQPRPPVVSIMGHVDHGKTKLLDSIRETNVAATEAGGITQHIGAYQVEKDGRVITFIDTPGHEAFTAMRARGAKATDIAILVVAADEGVKPQTIEAINHAKEAGIPIVVAINKIDKEGANPDRVKGELTELGLQPEDWGGQTMMVPISALKNQGLEDLLASVLLTAEVANLRANPNRPAVATVLETNLDPSLGPVATVVVNTGTLRLMDNIVVGTAYGRIKVMQDHLGKRSQEALPSTPVRIAGLSSLPQMGDILQVVKDERMARSQALQIKALQDSRQFASGGMTLEQLAVQIKKGNLKNLKLVIKADTKGSLEAVKQSLAKIPAENTTAKVIHSGIGKVSESDILMAEASQGIVIAFNVDTPAVVGKLAEREGVEILKYKIIYELVDNVTKLLAGLLEPEEVVIELGEAKVKKIFFMKGKEAVLGCAVTKDKVKNKAKLRIMRGGQEIGLGMVQSLKRVNEDVNEVNEGSECGIKFTGNVQVEEGDILQAYEIEMRKRSL